MNRSSSFFNTSFAVGCAMLGSIACSKSESASSSNPQATAVVSATASVVPVASSKPVVSKGQGKAGKLKKNLAQLPGLSELYDSASAAGVGKDLPKTVQAKAKDFSKMGSGERSIEVGIFLASLAIISLDGEKDVPLVVLEDAQKALLSLDPPEDVKRQVAALVADVKAGTLKGKELRLALDRLISQGIPLLEESEQHQLTARLMRTGAYLRVMALIARSLGDNKDPQKLSVLSQGPDQEFHTETMTKLTAALKEDPAVKKASESLSKLRPLVTKEILSSNDAQEIAKILVDYAR